MSDLKYQGLLERVSKLVMQYEDEIANLRVQITQQSDRIDQQANKIIQQTHEINQLQEELETLHV